MSYIIIICIIIICHILLCHNNKLSRLDACPSAMREGKNFNTHFWAAYGHNKFQQACFGKQIENVSKEINRTKWTLPASLSHLIIVIGGNIKSHRRDYSL